MKDVFVLGLGRIFRRCVVSGECFEFQGGLSRPGNGYPQVCVNGKKGGGHRFVYEAHFGPIPDGLCVMHKCDNTKCLNPAHLMVGTNKENTYDMIRKGRAVLIDPRRKLSESEVVEIKNGLASGFSIRKLAARFDVSKGTISFIKNGTNWGWVKP